MKIFLTCCFILCSGSVLADWQLIKCKGGESSSVSEKWCERDQWLVSLEGDRFFIADLKKAEALAPEDLEFYEIIPRDFITANERRLIGRQWVKVESNREVSVEARFPKGFFYNLSNLDESI